MRRAALLLGALVLAGCGGSKESAAPAETTPAESETVVAEDAGSVWPELTRYDEGWFCVRRRVTSVYDIGAGFNQCIAENRGYALDEEWSRGVTDARDCLLRETEDPPGCVLPYGFQERIDEMNE